MRRGTNASGGTNGLVLCKLRREDASSWDTLPRMLCSGDKLDEVAGFPLDAKKFGGRVSEDGACRDGLWD